MLCKSIISAGFMISVSVWGMPEQLGAMKHVRMCSSPGGLWSLENPCNTVHRRTFSAPAKSSSMKSNKLSHKEYITDSSSKKQKSQKVKKEHRESSHQVKKKNKQDIITSEIIQKPKKQQIISTKQNVINAQHQQQKTNQDVKKILKRKSFEKKFTNFLGDTIGKFIADMLFNIFCL